MKARRCRVCGGTIEKGATVCPHCGADAGRRVSGVWVLTFFVMGVVIGLMLLIVQRDDSLVWLSTKWSQPALEAPLDKPRQRAVTESGSTVTLPEGRRSGALPAVTTEPLRCDRTSARAVWEKARTLASISQQGDSLQLYLTREWEFYSPGHRRGFVEAFAEADHCLHGGGRTIHFSFQGREVAIVSAPGAVEMK